MQSRLLALGRRALCSHRTAGTAAFSVFLSLRVGLIVSENALRQGMGIPWQPVEGQTAPASLLLSGGFLLLQLLLFAPLRCGAARWQCGLFQKDPPGVFTLFYAFSRPSLLGKSILLGLFTGLARAFWFLVFLFPPFALLGALFSLRSRLEAGSVALGAADLFLGVAALLFFCCLLLLWVFLQRYSLVFYDLALFPQLSVPALMSLSARQTCGKRIPLAGLWLRLSPLLLLWPFLWPAALFRCWIGAALAALALDAPEAEISLPRRRGTVRHKRPPCAAKRRPWPLRRPQKAYRWGAD
ncbi:MAG: hypothetical protein PHD67_08905 [Oscillospiraceae bacterium]|nr:hypothetical protein [Oscillospiraceae bacterium]